MENAGYLAFIPPVLAIVLALLTKDVLVSLVLGIASGLLIAADGNVLNAFLNLSDLMADKASDSWNIRILLFCGLLGGLVGLLTKAGAARAFGLWASHFIKGRRSAQFFTWLCGLFIFIDDYFNSLAVGSVMRPVSDARGLSRAKLAYILDSTAAPVCILAPVSSWVVTVISQIRESSGFSELGTGEMSFFLMLIPYNIYALLALIMVLVVALSGRDFGPMAKSERLAELGSFYNQQRYGMAPGDLQEEGNSSRTAWYDMALPMFILIAGCIVAFPLTTYMDLEPGETMPLIDAFRNTDASKALLYGITFTLIFSYFYFNIRRVLNLKQTSEAIIDGVRAMLPALVILILAWSIGHVISKPLSEGGLGLPLVIDQMLRGSSLPLWVLPLCVFLLSGGIAFATGTSWGTFGIMIPIVLPTSVSLAQGMGFSGHELLQCTLIGVSAALSGAVFGDHASPISDTTILSSAGASCPHLEHVATQLPYACFVALCSGVGIVVSAYLMLPWVGLLAALVCFVPGFIFLSRKREHI